MQPLLTLVLALYAQPAHAVPDACDGFQDLTGPFNPADAQAEVLGLGRKNFLGGSVAIGDFDGDGIDDLAVGAPGADIGATNTGATFLFFGPVADVGAIDPATADAVFHGSRGQFTGTDLAFVGDMNGDGASELMIGSASGSAYLVNGSAAATGANDLSGADSILTGLGADSFGFFVNGAGDVNGDGVPDVLVRAENMDGAHVDAGVTHLFFGPLASSLTPGDADATFEGLADGDESGDAFGYAGDLDGDGVDDFAITSTAASINGNDAGGTFVFFGGAGLSGAYSLADADVTYFGARGSRSGSSFAPVPDVDGDGFDEIWVGARQHGTANAGSAFLMAGGRVGPINTVGQYEARRQGRDTWDQAGAGMAVGDFNGDALADLLLGADYADGAATDSGVVYVEAGPVSGTEVITNSADAWFRGGQAREYIGSELAVGDLNGDGVDDVVIGSWRNSSNGARAGRVLMYLGGGDVADEVTVYADTDDDGSGDPGNTTLACPSAIPAGFVLLADDCDDSRSDVFPGATESDCSDPVDYNCDGRTGLTDGDGDGFGACEDCNDNDNLVFPGAGELCGDGIDNDCDSAVDDATAVDAVTWYPDIDGDGFGGDAAAVSTCGDHGLGLGAIQVGGDCDDSDATVSPSAVEICDSIDNDCDAAIDDASAVGAPFWYADTDGDGAGDPASAVQSCAAPAGHVASATDCDDGNVAIAPGAVEACDGIDSNCDGLHYLGGDLTDAAAFGDISGSESLGSLGAVVAAGDLNNDGAADILATDRTDGGVLYGWFGGNQPINLDMDLGRPDGTDAWDLRITPTTGTAELGTSMAIADLNGDGTNDVIVGAPYASDGGTSRGSVFVFIGPVSGDLTTSDADVRIDGNANGDQVGASLWVGDVDGNGNDDLVIGAPGVNGEEGALAVFYNGFGSGTLTDADALLRGDEPEGFLGRSIAAGDLDDDGMVDLVGGAPEARAGQRGAIYVFFNDGFTGSRAADVVLTGERTGDNVGSSMDVPGDIDGDGLDDLLVGTGDNAAYVLKGGAVPALGEDSLERLASYSFGGPLFSAAGRFVTGVGDLNGDGLADFLIGAGSFDGPGNDNGAAYLVYGRMGYSDLESSRGIIGLNRHAAYEDKAHGATYEGARIVSDLPGGRFGVAAASADINGDGDLDLVIGAPATSNGSLNDAGRVVTLLAGPHGADSDALLACDADGDGCLDNVDFEPNGANFGDADGDGADNDCDLCEGDDSVGDLDGDGVCDDLDNDIDDDLCDNVIDPFPTSRSTDFDADGFGEDCDVADVSFSPTTVSITADPDESGTATVTLTNDSDEDVDFVIDVPALCPWISVDTGGLTPTEGFLPFGGVAQIQLTADTTGFTPGDYSCSVEVQEIGQPVPAVNVIPIALTVEEPGVDIFLPGDEITTPTNIDNPLGVNITDEGGVGLAGYPVEYTIVPPENGVVFVESATTQYNTVTDGLGRATATLAPPAAYEGEILVNILVRDILTGDVLAEKEVNQRWIRPDGNIVYWQIAGGGGDLLEMPADFSVAPNVFLGTSYNGVCVGCHSVSPGFVPGTDAPAIATAVGNTNNRAVVAYNADTRASLFSTPTVVEGSSHNDWDPTSSIFAHSQNGGIALSNVVTGITDYPAGMNTADFETQPTFSSDGSHIAFIKLAPGGTRTDLRFTVAGTSSIWTAPVDGGPAVELVPAEPGTAIYYPEFSPDGKWLVFNKSFTDQSGGVVPSSYSSSTAEIWMMPVDPTGGFATGPARRLDVANEGGGSNSWPVWSPDGAFIAFASTRTGDWDVFVAAIDAFGNDSPAVPLPYASGAGGQHIPNWGP